MSDQKSKNKRKNMAKKEKIVKKGSPRSAAKNPKTESQKDEKRESKLNIKKIRFKQVSTNGVKGKKILKSDVTFALDGKKSDAPLNERRLFVCKSTHLKNRPIIHKF